MTRLLFRLCLSSYLIAFTCTVNGQLTPNKHNAIATIEAHLSILIKMRDSIWALAEMSLKEYQSAEILARYAEK
ncbi:MAG: hypothetical protein ACK4IY_02720, partial [Chitinophagales bacterium]